MVHYTHFSHGIRAIFSQVKGRKGLGVVNVFDLEGHPKATRAYAWSSLIKGSDKRRFFAGLHMSGIKSPQDAVKEAIITEYKNARG
jgi:hypothetical protein